MNAGKIVLLHESQIRPEEIGSYDVVGKRPKKVCRVHLFTSGSGCLQPFVQSVQMGVHARVGKLVQHLAREKGLDH
jgi:hypothetical protein